MKILVIAPETDSLPGVSEEVAAISLSHEVTHLGGTVRESDIVDAIRDFGPFDVIWWVIHGGVEGIELSNHVIVNIQGIGQFVESSGARLCVLNSCSSESSARAIVVGSKAGIIFSISNIPDQTAVRFGSLLALELAKTDDIGVAFAASRPKQGDYRYLPANAVLRAMDLSTSRRVDRIQEQQDVNTQKLYELTVDQRAINDAVIAVRATLDKLRSIVDSNKELTDSEKMMRIWLVILTLIALINLYDSIQNIQRFFFK